MYYAWADDGINKLWGICKLMPYVNAVVLEIEWNDKKWCVMYTLLCWKLNRMTRSDALCTHYCVGNWTEWQEVMSYVHTTVLEIEQNDKKWCVMYTLLCWKLNRMTRSDALCTHYCVGNWKKSYAFCTRYCVGNWMKWQEVLPYVHATVLEIDKKKSYAFCRRYCVGNWIEWQKWCVMYTLLCWKLTKKKLCVLYTLLCWKLNEMTRSYAFCTRYCVGNWQKKSYAFCTRYCVGNWIEWQEVMRSVHATVLEIEKKVMRFVHATVLEIE